MTSSIILHQLLLIDYSEKQSVKGDDASEWSVWPRMSGLSTTESIQLFSILEEHDLVIGFPWDDNILFKLTNTGTAQLNALKNQGNNAVAIELTDDQTQALDRFVGNGVFIVHSDDPTKPGLATEVQRFVASTTGVEPEMLQPTPGQPLWEEFERHAANCGSAICVWSPDRENPASKHIRPNVLLETGYFLSRLPRGNVIAIKEDDQLNTPSDLAGIVWATKSNWKERLPMALFEARKRRLSR